MDTTLDIYTDGSCIGNGLDGAKAGIGVWVVGHPDKSISERIDGPQTNQVAELTAIKRALDLIDDQATVRIYSDSMYAIKCLTEWCEKWKKNGWKSSKRKPPINMMLVRGILDKVGVLESTGKDISFHHVMAHSGIDGNEHADRLAVSASRS